MQRKKRAEAAVEPGSAAEPVLDAPPDEFWRLLVIFTLSQRSWFIDLCSEFDLTPMQGHTLWRLDPDQPVAMSHLAGALACDASNVTGIIDKLESRGLIARQSAAADRRIKMLAITPKGRRMRDRLWQRMLNPPQALSGLSPDLRRQFSALLSAIIAERKATELLSRA